jgi:O-methyltransferase
MCELASETPAGDFAEVGVYQGGSAQRLYEVAMPQGRGLHLFDTFTGTPCHIEGLDKHKIDDEFAAPFTIKAIKTFLPLADLYIGIYPQTHPTSLNNLAFVHCDCDQYESYRAVIDLMWPLIVPNGILLFDDYPYLLGAKKAVEESFAVETLGKCGERYYVRKGDGVAH